MHLRTPWSDALVNDGAYGAYPKLQFIGDTAQRHSLGVQLEHVLTLRPEQIFGAIGQMPDEIIPTLRMWERHLPNGFSHSAGRRAASLGSRSPRWRGGMAWRRTFSIDGADEDNR